MQPFNTLTAPVVAMPNENIDTDQIIPARFLKTITKERLHESLFADWQGKMTAPSRTEEPANPGAAPQARILLAGDNFGCGSSREHAVWALTGSGYRAVISTSIADIFSNNALKNGLLPIVVGPDAHRALLEAVSADPGVRFTIDLATQTVRLPDGRSFPFPIDSFVKTCLLEGVDDLGYLLARREAVTRFEARNAS